MFSNSSRFMRGKGQSMRQPSKNTFPMHFFVFHSIVWRMCFVHSPYSVLAGVTYWWKAVSAWDKKISGLVKKKNPFSCTCVMTFRALAPALSKMITCRDAQELKQSGMRSEDVIWSHSMSQRKNILLRHTRFKNETFIWHIKYDYGVKRTLKCECVYVCGGGVQYRTFVCIWSGRNRSWHSLSL